MKKIAPIVLTVLVLAATIIFMRLYKFRINNEAVKLMDVKLTPTSVSFEVIQTHSGYYIKDYNYVVNDNILYIEFYGTMFSKFQLEDLNIVISENNVKDIVISDNIAKRSANLTYVKSPDTPPGKDRAYIFPRRRLVRHT